ncbi:MAG: citrate synthase family protein [Alphaproteobacteria bacterium]
MSSDSTYGTAPTPPYLTAPEAAAELNVSLATLYAYVSRGLIRSEARTGRRSRRYQAADVRALARRKAPADSTRSAMETALHWGGPVLESAITLIGDGTVYYRGSDATRLAADAGLEAVAGLIWDCRDADPFAAPPPAPPPGFAAARRAAAGLRPIERCQALLPLIAGADLNAFNLTPTGVAHTGARLVRWIAAILADTEPSGDPAHRVLARGMAADRPAAAALIRGALVLCADHELNASTFTVRCVASTGSSPYGAVLAGLAALQGPRHGGMTERVVAMLPTLLAAPDPRADLADRLRRGSDLTGFGHPLYPAGDPRARCLMALMDRAFPDDPMLDAAGRVAAAAAELAGRPPTLDFALALLTHRLGMADGSALGLFAAARTVGWIGHALEQYRGGRLIRPRARYTGVHP